MTKIFEPEEAAWKLYVEGMETIYLLEEEELSNYDHNNHDGLSIVPKEKLTEEEEDKLLWETFRNRFKGSKTVTLLSKAREMSGIEVAFES